MTRFSQHACHSSSRGLDKINSIAGRKFVYASRITGTMNSLLSSIFRSIGYRRCSVSIMETRENPWVRNSNTNCVESTTTRWKVDCGSRVYAFQLILRGIYKSPILWIAISCPELTLVIQRSRNTNPVTNTVFRDATFWVYMQRF